MTRNPWRAASSSSSRRGGVYTRTVLRPSSAIVAAYAVLLEGLARAGVPRSPAEAPEEYIRRVLASVDVRREPLAEADRLRFLRDFYTAQRAFLEREQLFGRRRADKHDTARDGRQ